MTAGQRTPSRRRRGERAASASQTADGMPGPDLGRLLERVEQLEARLAQLQQSQKAQLMEVIKFAVLRHASALTVMIEQSAMPAAMTRKIRREVDEEARRIGQAADLGEVRDLDLALQERLRRALDAFKAR